MKLKLTLATIINIKDKRIDAFKVVTLDNRITLFLSTASLQKAYDLDIKPDGFIRGIAVTDIQGFFNSVELAGDRPADLFTYMEKTLDLDAEVYKKLMKYEDLLKQVDFNSLPKTTQFEVFKGAAAALNEDFYIRKDSAEVLIKKYPKKKQLVVSASKGFA